MRTPTSFAKTRYDAQASMVPDGSATHDGDGRLVEIDTNLAKMAADDHLAAEEATSELDAQREFLAEFASVCQREVRPAMEAVVQRLRRDGGNGLIEKYPCGEARVSAPRLTL
ncbi:MAG: hypothetical protein ACRDZ8_14685 [Acidimicrobiales bacterium]